MKGYLRICHELWRGGLPTSGRRTMRIGILLGKRKVFFESMGEIDFQTLILTRKATFKEEANSINRLKPVCSLSPLIITFLGIRKYSDPKTEDVRYHLPKITLIGLCLTFVVY